jgi:hypothetical protein
VLRGTGAFESLRSGWRLFRANVGTSMLLVLLQQAIAFGAGVALGLAILALALPMIILAVAASATAAIVVGALTAVIVLPLALALFGALGAFSHGFWTLACLRLAVS